MAKSKVANAEVPADSAATRRWLWPSAAAGVLLISGLVVYYNSFQAPFVLDGIANVEQNPAVRSLSPRHFFSFNRPVGLFSFALNYALTGYKVWSYHAVNLLIHVAAAWLLFDLTRRTLARGRLAARYGTHAWGLSLLIALVWLVHPLQTESVTYVYQRYESLMGLFYLATLWCFLRALDSSSRWRYGWFAASVVVCVLGMGTKEVMVTAPLLVLWYDRVFAASSWRELFARRGAYYAALACTWGALVAMMVGQRGEYAKAGMLVVKDVSPLQYAITQPGVILHYLRLAFWPNQLCLDYGWPVADTAMKIVPYGLGLLVLLALTVWAMFRWPGWGFLAGTFFLILAPSSSVMPLVDLAFEYRMYLSLAPLVAMVVLAGYHAWQYAFARFAAGQPGSHWFVRAIPVTLLLVVTVALGWRTLRRNEDYRSLVSIWQVTARQSPEHFRVHSSLGKALADRGDFAAGIKELTLAIQYKPSYSEYYVSRGSAYARSGNHRAAMDDFNQAVLLDQHNAKAFVNRANLYAMLSRFDLAIEDCSDAIELDPNLAYAYILRAHMYGMRNQHELAERDFTRAIELQPTNADAHTGRAKAREMQGKRDQALDDAKRACELTEWKNPNCLDALSTLYAAAGNFADAAKWESQAIALGPQDPNFQRTARERLESYRAGKTSWIRVERN